MIFARKFFTDNSLGLVIVCSLIFSAWMMFHTFSYTDGNIEVAAKAWSDFAGHIPLIRSFSLGENFPPQYPIFPGQPIKYHFLFYFLVGSLEKIGLPLDLALNIPSAISMALLITMIYLFSWKVFRSRTVGLLTVIFFLFNGSWTFLEFFKSHSLSFDFVQQIISLTTFPSFGPYDGKVVSAFWNLNIYTNQRHLALAYGLSLILIFVSLQPALKNQKPTFKMSFLLGLILGIYPFLHLAVFLMNVLILGVLFLLIPKSRLSIFIILLVGAVMAIPQYLYLQSAPSTFTTKIVPGYLIADSLTIFNFLRYWFLNLGLHLILIPVGFILAPPLAKKILVAFLPLFLIGNLVQFTPEIAANHKFFNYFLIIGASFSAYALVFVWQRFKNLRIFTALAFVLLIFSGILDLFPIINDQKIILADYPKNTDIAWIINNTPKTAVFLNTNYLYDSASLAGRKIFMGWPYFAWSAGYDTNKRFADMTKFFSSTDKNFLCSFLNQNKIDYVELLSPSTEFAFSQQFWQSHFKANYMANSRNYAIYNKLDICQNRDHPF